ncbi:MAG: hypothetical protein WA749_12605 [Gelidibacter sp.]
MFQSITSYLLFGNQYCGIEHTSHHNTELIYTTILKKNKKALHIQDTFEYNNIEDLSNDIPKNTHAYLILNNENILTKKLEGGSKEAIQLVQQAFPNINVNDFMYDALVQDGTCFVSICRKTYVEEIISAYKSKGISIINISLGNIIIANTIDYINSNPVSTSNAKIDFSNNEIHEIETSQTVDHFNYDINGLDINNKLLLSLAGALVSALGNLKSITNYEAEIQHLKTAYSNSVFFRKFLTFGLILVFSSLLINVLAFNHYFNKVNALQQTSQVNQNMKTQVTELNEKATKSQKMVEDLLNNNNSKSSYYINEIIKELPTSIQLEELNYQPILKRIKSEEAIKNEPQILLVSGQSTSSNTFSNWVSLLEKKPWLNKIEVSDYSDISNAVANFTFKILLNHDK